MELTLIEALIPEEILNHFEFTKIELVNGCYQIDLIEKKDVGHIPKEMLEKGKAVLDGFMNPIELQSYPLKGKELFLILRRRKWKLKSKGSQTGYYNKYSFARKGMKATKEFGDFLKEIGRG